MPYFLASAISRQDGSPTDGIHLLWSPPRGAGYAVGGFDIQRRPASGAPEPSCYTLTPNDLAFLHATMHVPTPVGDIRLRQAPCPRVTPPVPDDPFPDPEGDPDPERCVELTREGAAGNPRLEGGMRFEVLGADGQPTGSSTVVTRDGHTGLDCGARLRVTLPAATAVVELTVVAFEELGRVEAFDGHGTAIDGAQLAGPVGQPETVRLAGPGIERVELRARGTTLLVRLCRAGGPSVCHEFEATDAEGPNPVVVGLTRVTMLDAAGVPEPTTHVTTWGQVTGLECGAMLEVALPTPVRTVELTLASFADAVDLTAFDALGAIVDTDRLDPGPPRRLRLSGRGIRRVMVVAPSQETLLVRLCYVVDDRAPVDPAPSGEPSLVSDGREPAPRACLAYDISPRQALELVRVVAGVPAVLAIALRAGKAVGARLASDASGSQDVTFANGPIDRVLLYTRRPVSSLVICGVARQPPADEDSEWSGVPFLATGIQLPLRAVDPTLATAADEEALAASRLAPPETFDAGAFRGTADVMNEAAAGAVDASPMWRTMLTREQVTDPPIDTRPWPLALSLLLEPAWRRMLGFGYLDRGANLTPGDAYDYRVIGHFRRRDVEEEVLGFHTVPLGTTLPVAFQLGSVLLQTPEPTQVELWPAPAAGDLRAAGRKGIRLASGSGGSPRITFPDPIQVVVLELEPAAGISVTSSARTSEYLNGLSGTTFTATVPNQARVQLVFPEPVDTVALDGAAFLYDIRIPATPGANPMDVVTRSVVLRGVRYERTDPPPPPLAVGTVNLQEPVVAASPGATPRPPRGLGFRVVWQPPPSGAAVVPWPDDLAAYPPLDAAGFEIERRRVDTGGPFEPLDGASPRTRFFGNRGVAPDPEPLAPGVDLLAVFPEARPPTPPVPAHMHIDDLLVTRAAGGPPPGSRHQYRVWTVDAIGRRSPTPRTGSEVRLEKHTPPPQPVGPPQAPPAGTTRPAGVRARVLVAGDPELTTADGTLLGSSANAVVLEWGWTAQERDKDPHAVEFRVYWQERPPDVLRGTLTGTAVRSGDVWQLGATLEQNVVPDALRGRYLTAGGYPFRVHAHTGGTSVQLELEPSRLDPPRAPTAGAFEVIPVLDGAELRPARWTRRAAVVPLTSADTYQLVLRDQLALGPTSPRARAWIGVSAADAQPYVPDELPAGVPNGGRPGNESGVVPVDLHARYIGRPVFMVPPPLPDVPEQVTDEPAGPTVPARLDLPVLLPTVTIPAGHRVVVERVGFDQLAGVLGARPDGTIEVTLPDGAVATYTLANPDDRSAFVAQIRTGVAGRVETRFLMDLLLRQLAGLEPLWRAATTGPVPFGPVTDELPDKAERYAYRIRLADPAGHLSAGGAVLPLAVRVPSLRAPGTPELDVTAAGAVATVRATVLDAWDLRWVLIFSTALAALAPNDGRTLEKAALLRLPNRRDLYPEHGIRLRLRDGSLLAPTVVDATTGTVANARRTLTATLTSGFDRRVAVWTAGLTRDGIPSRFAGPRTVYTDPQPLTVPALTVTAGADGDSAAWASTPGVEQWGLERRLNADGTWARVSPWLPAAVTAYLVADPPAGTRRYRLVARGSRGRRAEGSEVLPV